MFQKIFKNNKLFWKFGNLMAPIYFQIQKENLFRNQILYKLQVLPNTYYC